MVEMMESYKRHPLYREDLDMILGIPGIESLRGKSFLITGATGLIGVCLIDALMYYNRQGAGITLYATGRSKEKAFSRLGEYAGEGSFHFIEQDVREPFPVEVHPDYIIPLASNTHPIAYSRFPVETIEINVEGAMSALKKAQECGATVLYPSSVEVYGNARGSEVFTEDYSGVLDLSTARSCYTESKRVSESLCQSFHAERNVVVKIVRLSRVFGPTMLMNDTKASSQFVLSALKRENIVLKSTGEQFFSFVYVADAVAAMLYVLIHGINGEVYNIANDACNVHLNDFARTCSKVAGTSVVFDIPSEIEKRGYSVAMRAIMSADKLRALGFTGCYTFDEAIRRTLSILESRS